MKININTPDRIIRVVLGLLLVVLFFVIDGPWRWIGLAGLVLLATAAMSWCPIYAMLGISTHKIPVKQN